ncbi:MAG: TatD family hydrolase [Clostridia bacterium]|nr:TatD family hydrolase [Clostridia bacterium]
MIADSHAHLSHFRFEGRFFGILPREEDYATGELSREELFLRMQEEGVVLSIEPAIELSSNRRILALHQRYPRRVFCAVGVHPTRTFFEKWRARRALEGYLSSPGVVAVGETGLDLHMRGKKHLLCQTAWFLYQVRLAKKHRLPLVLHTRRADRWVQCLLRLFGRGGRGGVVHCFSGDGRCARRYLEMGYYIGIGGTLLQEGEDGQRLRGALKDIPLECILAETDAPYVLPTKRKKIGEKSTRNLRNTPLILKEVIGKIAQIKGVSFEEAERVIFENTLRLFRLSSDQ